MLAVDFSLPAAAAAAAGSWSVAGSAAGERTWKSGGERQMAGGGS